METVTPSSVLMKVETIAIGEHVLASDCRLTVDLKNRVYQLSFRSMKSSTLRVTRSSSIETISFQESDIIEVKFYEYQVDMSPGNVDKSFPFLALRVENADVDEFASCNQFYAANTMKQNLAIRQVVIEFRDNFCLRSCVNKLREDRPMNRKFTSAKLTERTYKQYCRAQINHYNSDAQSSSTTRVKSVIPFLDNRAPNDIIFVYPFAGNTDDIDEASKGLNEARGLEYICSEETPNNMAASTKDSSQPIKYAGRDQFVTIKVEDCKRLEPCGWLNDNLVDFWMRWYVHVGFVWRSNLVHFLTLLDLKDCTQC